MVAGGATLRTALLKGSGGEGKHHGTITQRKGAVVAEELVLIVQGGSLQMEGRFSVVERCVLYRLIQSSVEKDIGEAPGNPAVIDAFDGSIKPASPWVLAGIPVSGVILIVFRLCAGLRKGDKCGQ